MQSPQTTQQGSRVSKSSSILLILLVGATLAAGAGASGAIASSPSKALDAPAGDMWSGATPFSFDPAAALSSRKDAPASELLAGCPTTALPTDGSTSGNARAPLARFRGSKAVYLITAAELAASGLPSGALSGIGWRYSTAPGVVATGTLIVYLENTTDTTFLKSTSFTTATSTMTLVHSAAATLPNTTSPFDIPFSGGTSFTYTGGGLYVAFEWLYPAGTLSTTGIVSCNTALALGLASSQTTATPPSSDTLTASNWRPETRLTPTLGFANDAGVDLVMTLGAIPAGVASPHVVRAVVTNRGTSALADLPVTLNITGAESFSNTQNVAALAACGGQAIVSFAPFSPSALGSNAVTVSVPADDNAANNSASKPLDATANRYSYKYPGSTPSGGVGFNGGTGQFVSRFSSTGATQVNAVTVEFFSVSATAYRLVIYGDDGTGKPGAQLYVDAADRTVSAAGSTTIRLPAPVAVGPGNFFVGVQQMNVTNVSFSFDTEVPIRSGDFFFSTVLNAGPWTDQSPGNNFKPNIGITVGACLVPLVVDVTPDGTSSTCAGNPLTFNAGRSGGTGAVTYQWTENGSDIAGETGASLTLSKASPGSFAYNCELTDDGGCSAIVDATSSTGTWLPDGAACDDANPCTSGDTCGGGSCQPGTNPCDDGNACTNDLCIPSCSHTPVNCDDVNPCTDDGCNTSTGCTHAANANPCSDGSPCTAGDACAGGICVPGPVPGYVDFCNSGSIAINDGAAPAAATPYPSNVVVSGQGSHVCSVKVGLYGLSHAFPDDIDILLGGPAAGNSILMSDVGGGNAAVNLDLELDDAAGASLPDAGPLVSGFFRPTNVDPGTGTESWPAPAPAPLGGSALAVFDGTDPNGTWSLYVVDDEAGDFGSIAGGWCLFVATACASGAECDDGDPCTLDTCAGSGCQHTALGTPAEVLGVNFGDDLTLSWGAEARASQYDVVRGALSALPVGPGDADEVCFPNEPGTSLQDPTLPGAPGGFWYLVRGENACTAGTWGTASSGSPRVTTTCP